MGVADHASIPPESGLQVNPSVGSIGARLENRGGPARLASVERPTEKHRVLVEDALKLLIEAEQEGRALSAFSMAAPLGLDQGQAEELLARLAGAGLAEREGAAPRLTGPGREYALQVLRAHRLYEAFLAQTTGLKDADWHGQAHDAEHRMSPEAVERMAAELGHPVYDPHGDPIPGPDGRVPPPRGRPLGEFAPGAAVRVVHVEDEPPDVFAGLAREGVARDVRLRVEQIEPSRVRVRMDGRDIDLSRTEAAQITAAELPPGEVYDDGIERLTALAPGERAEVVGLSPLLRGLARSRLLDLGFVPGTVLEIDLVSPGGDPTAYRVRGASIALRREQTERIRIRRVRAEAVR